MWPAAPLDFVTPAAFLEPSPFGGSDKQHKRSVWCREGHCGQGEATASEQRGRASHEGKGPLPRPTGHSGEEEAQSPVSLTGLEC